MSHRWSALLCCSLLMLLISLPAAADVGGPAASIDGVDGAPGYRPEIAISTLNNEQLLPSIAHNWKHNEYLVVWHNKWGGSNRDVYAQRVSHSGKVLSWFSVTSGATDRAQPDVAYDPDNDRYLVTWTQDASGGGTNWDIWGRLIPWQGPSAALTEFRICDWPTLQWNPHVEYAGTAQAFLVVWWTQHPSLPGYTSGRRVLPDGTMPQNAFLIASHGTENRVGPRLAYNQARNEYLVTVHSGVDIFGVRLTGTGSIIGGGEFGIAAWPDAERNQSVAACPAADRYLVTWQSLQGGDEAIYARIVLGNGTPDTVFPVFDTVGEESVPDVSCARGSDQFLVTWQEQYSNASGPYGIWGRFVHADASMGAAFGISAPQPPGYTDRRKPAVEGGAGSFLTVWEYERPSSSYVDIYGRLVTPWAVNLPLMRR